MDSELQRARTRADESQLKTALHKQIIHCETQNKVIENLSGQVATAGACIDKIKGVIEDAEKSLDVIGRDFDIVENEHAILLDSLMSSLKKAIKKAESGSRGSKAKPKRGSNAV